MQSWDPVVVNDETLETHGRAGRVTSAGTFKGAGKHRDDDFVDVQLDATATAEQVTLTFPAKSIKTL